MYLQEAQVKLKRRYSSVDVLKFIKSSLDAVDYAFTALYDDCEDHREHLFVIFLSWSNKVIGHKLLSTGSSTGCVCDVKEILLIALTLKAESIMLFHNHPSGSLNRSVADESLTKKLKLACMTMDLVLLDHIIVTAEKSKYYSFADEGQL